MIFRNSIKSILRTPVKTLLFALLIAAVSAFFYLGINTWVASTAMLADCDDNHTTIVTMEYLSGFLSQKGYKSRSMLEQVAAVDFDAIADNENVLLWQPADVSLGFAMGFSTRSNNAEDYYNCVMIVTGLREYNEEGYFICKLVDSLYSTRQFNPGSGIFLESTAVDFGFEPDPNATYVILGRNTRVNSMGGLSIELKPFYSWTAQAAGIDCDSIAVAYQIESVDDFYADPDNIYLAIANYYEATNNTLAVHRACALEELEEFSQEYLQLVSGRLFTREESDAGERVCVISQTLAKNCDLAVGDTLTLHLPDDEEATVYAWGDTLSRQESYTIVGIVNYHADYHLNVYTPAISDANRPMRYLTRLGQATIKNGTTESFLSLLEELLPEDVLVSVYDQGYQTTADALTVIQKASIALTLIALLVTIVVLAFFAYLFADIQREAVEVMRCFGMKKGEARRYLMIGVTLIALTAIFVGIFIGTLYATSLIEYAYSFISELQIVDSRYSDGFRGIVKEFTPVATMSYPLAFAVGTAIFLGALSLCLYFAERVVSGRLISVRAKARIRKPPKRSSVALRGWLRHATLSIRRSGMRSTLVPLLCAAALLFVSSLQATLASYDEAREDLYDNTQLSAYLAQMNGKFSGELFIPNDLAMRLRHIESLSNFTYTYRFNYVYLGVSRYADGTEGQPDPVPQPVDFHHWELLWDILNTEPPIIFTDSVADSPEFYFNDFQGEFLPGWDQERFSSRDWEQLPCILSSQFLQFHDIDLGDTICLYIENVLSGYPFFLPVYMQVVGSFIPVSNENNIYCPMPSGSLAPRSSKLADLQHKAFSFSYLVAGSYSQFAAAYYPMNYAGDPLTDQQFFDVLLDSASYISSLTFTLDDSRRLPEIKDELKSLGFSGPDVDNNLRLYVVIQDSQFTETLSSLAQRTKYLEILYPILLVLICILALITGYLSVNSRREDIALMRGMGVHKKDILITIFGEQVLLLLLGLLPAALGWYFFKGGLQLTTPAVYGFFLCYAFAAILSTIQQNAKKALTILSEKE